MMDLACPRMAKGLQNWHRQNNQCACHYEWALILTLHHLYALDIAPLAPK